MGDRAAVAAFKVQLDRLEELTRALFLCVEDIKGFGAGASAIAPAPTHQKGPALDPDRLHASATVVATLFIAFCFWIYVDPPMHSLFVFLPTQWAMVAALTRQNVLVLVPGISIGIVISSVAYVFVMPQLSGYAELGTMLFLVTFVVFWLCFEPHRRGIRAASLAMFVVTISLENDQTGDDENE